MTKPYTVLLMYPDYIAANYGGETYLAHVDGSNVLDAVNKAQADAVAANYEDEADREQFYAEGHSGDDFEVLLVIEGHHDDLWGGVWNEDEPAPPEQTTLEDVAEHSERVSSASVGAVGL